MMVVPHNRSPKEDLLGHPAILSDSYSKINVKQAVEHLQQSRLNNARIGTHDLSNSATSLERVQADDGAGAVLHTLPNKGARGAGNPAHGLRRSIPTAPSSMLHGSKMATMQIRRRPLSGIDANQHD